MSLHGVRQLKELTVRYSDLDGSSRGVRDWMRVKLVSLASNNPEVEIKTELKRAVHPYLRGVYKNGNSKTICIKNLPVEEIETYALFLRNQIGRRVRNVDEDSQITSQILCYQLSLTSSIIQFHHFFYITTDGKPWL